ncbi:hypothetical protein CY0110_18572 [Crocosphaera chwakensis CCY0110]|uniref:Uncharacterized protein n=1 Tax=Crocosphaera chwakensis CCY0110 TaxID=391612 RepID=A3IJ46_9CHRO|nr:hypothetical protein CY0110_18572 [Crocosphaera chwakensis CCY0110]
MTVVFSAIRLRTSPGVSLLSG